MFLACARRLYRPELRADFRRYYGVAYSEVERLSPVEAADLAFLLPLGSNLKSAIDPALSWTREELLLAMTVNAVAKLGGAKKPIVRMPEPKKRAGVSVDMDDLAEILSRPRKEVNKNG